MRVLQINGCHYRRGGADVVYFNTAELLQQKGHDVSFFSVTHPKNVESEFSSHFVESKDIRKLSFIEKIKEVPAFIYNYEAYNKLSKLIDEFKPDVAHVHLFLASLSSSILKCLRDKNVPIVFSVHDYRFICPAYLFLDGENKVCERCKDGFYMHCTINKCSEGNLFQSLMLTADAYFRKYILDPRKYIDNFLFVSNFIKEKHSQFNDQYALKSSVLYNFIPKLETIAPAHQRGDYFLYYGRLSREKGVKTLVDVANQIGLKLKVVGTGTLSKSLDTGSSNVEFLGHKTGNELWELLRNASFVVVPSEWYENNPLTILEAYANGKPVIGANIGGIPEIIDEGKTGYLFGSGNKTELMQYLMKALALTDDQYLQMSDNARKFAEAHFNPENHYKGLIHIYNQVINQACV